MTVHVKWGICCKPHNPSSDTFHSAIYCRLRDMLMTAFVRWRMRSGTTFQISVNNKMFGTVLVENKDSKRKRKTPKKSERIVKINTVTILICFQF